MKKPSPRIRIARNISLPPLHDKAVTDELAVQKKINPKANYSEVVQFAIAATYMQNASGPEGRAAAYLDARDRALEFEEDCAALLLAEGYEVERGAKVNDSHRVDLLVKCGKKSCIIELKSSGRRSRLELVLGQALLLKSRAKVPVVVCVPYMLESSTAEAFELARVTLTSPATLVAAVKKQIG